MNQRDISQIKRRLNPEQRNPTMIRGCYVSTDGRVISAFAQPVFDMPQEENEKYMALFKRTLSGTIGQNLLSIPFSPSQMMDGEQHRLLTCLRDSALKDETVIDAFFQRVIEYIGDAKPASPDSAQSAQKDENYLILLMHDAYDVPYRDACDHTDPDQSTQVFQYVMCCVCPVKRTKPALSYFVAENEFHSRETEWVVGAPELGFLFPAFEDGGANLSSALYYTRDIADTHEAFAQSLFGASLIPAAEQKEAFQNILSDTLAEECRYEVIQAVNETVSEMIKEQKADKAAEPLKLDRQSLVTILDECGVSKERTQAFEQQYNAAFGEFSQLDAVNIASPGQLQVKTPSVCIKVAPENSNLIETRIIDGRKYILILADGAVEVNGVPVNVGE